MTGGAVYTRWGTIHCPDVEGTELVYYGRAVGTWHNTQGGAANYLCMPKDGPQYTDFQVGIQGYSPVYGAQYQTLGSPLDSVNGRNVPCAVCHVTTRAAVMMIPGMVTCPSSWTKEYYGYLMANHYRPHRTMFECMDRYPEAIPGTVGVGALFWHTEAKCTGGLHCPPYDEQKELTCVVCTK